jgi:drug/metabolite transporter superfamily protein YnfA
VLDWITHRPDLPLWPGGPVEGLGLWNSVAGTVIVESVMFVAGVALYFTVTRARDRIGSIATWAMVVLLAVMYVLSSTAPPPPSTRVIAAGGLVVWLFPLWAWWMDRHREPVV